MDTALVFYLCHGGRAEGIWMMVIYHAPGEPALLDIWQARLWLGSLGARSKDLG